MTLLASLNLKLTWYFDRYYTCIHRYNHTCIYAYTHHPLQSFALWNLWLSWTAKSTLLVLFYFIFLRHVLLQNLSAKLYSALRMLRTLLVKEAGEGVMAYHIFGFVFSHFPYSCTIISIYDYFCLWESRSKINSFDFFYNSFRMQYVFLY